MKEINIFLQEKLRIDKNIKVDDPENRKYTFKARNKDDLKTYIINCCKNDTGEIVDLNCIDVSNIVDMAYIFTNNIIKQYLNNRNIDISGWNVSNLMDAHNCFDGLENFDCDLSEWNVENLRNADSMFSGCKKFRGKGLDKWKLPNIQRLAYMFYNCKDLNVDLSNWDISNIDKSYANHYTKYSRFYANVFLGSKIKPKYRIKHNGRAIT